MNWFRENKFLAGFVAVLIIGAGALGYLLYSAYGEYAEVSDQYNAQASALHALQSRVPYPDQKNLASYRAERDGLKDATNALASKLAGMVLPVEELAPSAFQDRLRDTVSLIVGKAGRTGVKLPEHFSLDFDRYQSQPPIATAAGPLGRQLAALAITMNILIDDHVDVVTSLQRTPLPQEGGAATHAAKPGLPGVASSSAGANLVEKFPFEIRFVAGQPAFQRVLNDFAASGKQYFITRMLVVANTDPKPVQKVSATSAPGASPPPDTAGGSYLKFIVGTEKVDVAMRIDMVTFNPPAKSARKGAPPSR